jgi:hypothetical protein
MALPLSSVYLGGLTSSIKPTWLLIDEVGTTHFTVHHWTALKKRTLTRDQEVELIGSLLDKRNKRGSLPTSDDQWLGAMLQAGLVPEDLSDRYDREMIRAEFAASPPAAAAAGQPLDLAIEIHDARPSFVKERLLIVIDGAYLDDANTPMGRRPTPIEIKHLPRTDTHRSRRLPIDPQITPERPGPMRVRFVFWHLYTTKQFSNDPVMWNEANEPVLPTPSAVIWSRRVELETVVPVSAP